MPIKTAGSAKRSVVATPNPAHAIWLAALLAVMVGKMADWIPGLEGFPLAKLAFVLAAINALRSRASLPPVRVRSIRIARPALAFLLLSIASVLFSVYKSNTLIVSQLSLIYILTFALLLKVVRTGREVERLLQGLLVASISLTLGVLLNYHGDRASINANFDPNDIAYSLDTLLPIVLALRAGKSKLATFALNFLAVSMAIAILLTGSRGGAIGLCVDLLLLMSFPMAIGANGLPKKFESARTIVKVGVAAAVIGASWGHLPSETRERLLTLLDLSSDYNADPTLNSSRTVIWRRDIQLSIERPIGYGMGSAAIVDGLNGGQYRTAHNSIVQAFVELGILGLLLYLWSYYVTWRELGRIARSGHEAERGKFALYARALRIALAANMAAGFFLSQAYSSVLWMTIAVSAALVHVMCNTNVAATEVASSRTRGNVARAWTMMKSRR